MSSSNMGLSRISKLLVDRDQVLGEDAMVRRKSHTVTLMCGRDIEYSYTLQLAVLTAANIASRCFPGAVRIALDPILRRARLLLWPWLDLTFEDALCQFVDSEALHDEDKYDPGSHVVVFGNAATPAHALRATFDGWIAKVGPAPVVPRLLEREYCSLAGILTGSLAMSELFLSFAGITLDVGRRTTGLSLWRPDADIGDPAALGVRVERLPRELWTLGLGHLGNAYLWTLATLPYADPKIVEFYLNDFDKIEEENIETGMVFGNRQIGHYKTRACSDWLGQLKFETRIIERRFDSGFRCRVDEPQLAFCGFDSNPARRDLATAQFLRVMESGLGGTSNNFDTISVHTLPHPKSSDELWPDLPKEEEEKLIADQARVARDNAAYSRLGKDTCGRYELAGKAIAVPFVGTTAASIVAAEALRLLHGGPAYTDIKLRLSAPDKRLACSARTYVADDCGGIKFCVARSPE